MERTRGKNMTGKRSWEKRVRLGKTTQALIFWPITAVYSVNAPTATAG